MQALSGANGLGGNIALNVVALIFAAAQTGAQISQATAAPTVAPINLVLAPQGPDPSATSGHQTPGSLVIALASPVGSGTHAGLIIEEGGTAFFRTDNATAGGPAIYLGPGAAAPVSDNWALAWFNGGAFGVSATVLSPATSTTATNVQPEISVATDGSISFFGGTGFSGASNPSPIVAVINQPNGTLHGQFQVVEFTGSGNNPIIAISAVGNIAGTSAIFGPVTTFDKPHSALFLTNTTTTVNGPSTLNLNANNALVGTFAVTSTTSDFLAFGTPHPAGDGCIRVCSNVTAVSARDSGNSKNIHLLSIDSSDNLVLGGAATHDPNGIIGIGSHGVTVFQFAQVSTDYVAFNGTPATTGYVRADNNSTIVTARNSVNNNDIICLATDGSDNVVVNGNAGFGKNLILNATTGNDVSIRISNVNVAIVTSTTFTILGLPNFDGGTSGTATSSGSTVTFNPTGFINAEESGVSIRIPYFLP